MLILAQLETRPSHGYEVAQSIAARSHGAVAFHVASLYPILYRLERRGLIAGRWVEKSGQRRRRYYSLTPKGRKVLAAQRRTWSAFMQAVQAAAGVRWTAGIGDHVVAGQPLFELHTDTPERIERARESLAAAVTIGAAPSQPSPLVRERIA